MPRWIGIALLGGWLVWAAAALWLGGVGPQGPWPWRAAALAVVVGALGAGWRTERFVPVGAAIAALVTVWYATIHPASDRAWSEDQSRLPRIEIDGDQLVVRDLRTFRYRSAEDWDARWVDRTFDLSRIEGIDFGIARFSPVEAVAHTMISVRFENAEPLVISVEVRREQGERYGPVRGLFRQFELMYVLADEADAVALRAVHGDAPVYLHPMRATPAQARAFVEHILASAQRLVDRPRFYNTVTASCTSVLAGHLRAVFELPLDHRVYLPGYSDALAYELDLIDTSTDFASTREANRINGRARASIGSATFSAAIREGRSDGR